MDASGRVIARLDSPLPSSLAGSGERVVVAENQALRVLDLSGGGLDELGILRLPGTESIPGVVGLSP